MKRFIQPLILVALVAALAACGSGSKGGSDSGSESPKSAKIVIGVGAAQANLLLPFLAKEIGAFQAEGLDAEISMVPGPQLLPALAGNKVQFALSSAPAPDIAGLKSPVSVIGTWAYGQGLEFLLAPGVKSIAGLRGKPVGFNISRSFGLSMLAEHALKDGDLTYDDVKPVMLQDYSSMVSAFISGQIDAIVAGPPAIQQIKKERPGTTTARTFEDVPFASPGITVNPTWASKHKDTVVATLRALNKALAVWTAEPEKAYAVIATAQKLQADDPLVKELYKVTTDTFLPNVEPITPDVEKKVLAFVRNAGFPDATDDKAAKLVDPQFAEAASK